MPTKNSVAELKRSIQEWKQHEPQFAVYEMARLTWYLGAWIHHSRWYPDWQRRIYNRQKTQFSGAIHSALRYDGPIGRLRGDLLHYTIRNFAEHEAKLDRYTTAIAQGDVRQRPAQLARRYVAGYALELGATTFSSVPGFWMGTVAH